MAIEFNTNSLLNNTSKSEEKKSADDTPFLLDAIEDQTDNNQTYNQHADQVKLTYNASLLKDIEVQLGQVPAVDHAKVAKIKAALISGEYNIDADSVAEKLMNLEIGFDKDN